MLGSAPPSSFGKAVARVGGSCCRRAASVSHPATPAALVRGTLRGALLARRLGAAPAPGSGAGADRAAAAGGAQGLRACTGVGAGHAALPCLKRGPGGRSGPGARGAGADRAAAAAWAGGVHGPRARARGGGPGVRTARGRPPAGCREAPAEDGRTAPARGVLRRRPAPAGARGGRTCRATRRKRRRAARQPGTRSAQLLLGVQLHPNFAELRQDLPQIRLIRTRPTSTKLAQHGPQLAELAQKWPGAALKRRLGWAPSERRSRAVGAPAAHAHAARGMMPTQLSERGGLAGAAVGCAAWAGAPRPEPGHGAPRVVPPVSCSPRVHWRRRRPWSSGWNSAWAVVAGVGACRGGGGCHQG